jgi:alpha-glucosidase
MFWMRSGGLKSKGDQVMSWAGDQTVDWTRWEVRPADTGLRSDGLPSSIVSALSLATSGMGLTHSDIGGYTGSGQFGLVRTKELLLRWAEYSIFSPVMRTHEVARTKPEMEGSLY